MGTKQLKKEVNQRATMYVLTQEQINEIAAIGAKEALKVHRKERQKDERKRARDADKVKQTKKMLSSYRRIKATLEDEEELTEEEKTESAVTTEAEEKTEFSNDTKSDE